MRADERPWILDLFCGAGGAGEGYRRAGFHVVGVDIDPKPLRHNPHECYQGDALDVLNTLLAGREWQGYTLHDFQAIHASPPCQHYVQFLHGRNRGYEQYPDLVGPVRERLIAADVPYVLENVPTSPVRATLVLCGSSFGLRVRRHRRFEMNWLAWGLPCRHREQGPPIGVYGNGGPRNPGGRGRRYKTKADASDAMGGLDWMTIGEMTEAIPVAYTEWIGRQLLAAISAQEVAV